MFATSPRYTHPFLNVLRFDVFHYCKSLSFPDLDARPWDFQADECALRACVDRFNSRRYGIENGDRIDGGEEDEYLPVDNDILSVLGEKVELSNEFKNNYERWLDREVFSVSIDWDQLCTCDTTAEVRSDHSMSRKFVR